MKSKGRSEISFNSNDKQVVEMMIKLATRNEELITVCDLDHMNNLDEVDRERLAIRRFAIECFGLKDAHELRKLLKLPGIEARSKTQ